MKTNAQVSRRIEDDNNSGLAFFLLFWTLSLGFFLSFVSLVLFLCLCFRRSRDSNDGGWLLLCFSCFCSSVPLLPFLYAAQFSFMSTSVSFYSPCSLFLPLYLVFLLVFPPYSALLSSPFVFLCNQAPRKSCNWIP